MMPQSGNRMDAAQRARRLLRARHSAAMATQSQRHPGYPFGSVVDYLLEGGGAPLLLISDLAQHTRNLQANARLSLLVGEATANVQANARLTLLGDAEGVEMTDVRRARYLRYFPDAEAYFDMHDFFFYRVNVHAVRFIGGFGDVYWLEPDELFIDDRAVISGAPAVIEHMNQAHGAALAAFCLHFYGRDGADTELVGIDGDGFDLRQDGELLRCDFPNRVHTADEARHSMMSLARLTGASWH